jgi:NDP-sugar pyrophosphorylase family protein
LVDLFLKQGIKEIAVLINEDFREEFNWWKKRYYSLIKSSQGLKIKLTEEKEPLGTFGGLWYLKDWIGENSFFLTNGDELKKINLKKMVQFHNQLPVLATIALVKVPDPQDYGVVVCQKGIIEEFLQKPENPPTEYINSGLYFLSSEIFERHPGPKFSMIEEDLFPKLTKEKKLAGFKFNGKWTDCGTWERYEKALKSWE